MTKIMDALVYRVDAQDRLTYVNSAWEAFALENATEDVAVSLARQSLVGRSLWDYVTDRTMRMLYWSVMARVRSDDTVRFIFRCDSPDCRRLHKMEISSLGAGELEFRTTPIAIESRPYQPLLDATAPRSEAWISMCSWCNRVQYLNDWYEVEVAIGLGALFEMERTPQLTHVICDNCYRQIQESVSARRTG